jgi:foldase protein PrsA
MEMKTRFVLVPLLIAATAALAACGGGSKAVPPNDVALVGSTPVTKTQFNGLITQAIATGKARGQAVPKVGSTEYTTLRQDVVNYLVQNAELQQQAAKLGVTVTQKDIDAYLQSLQKLSYGNSAKKLDAAIKASGLTVAQARRQIYFGLLGQKVKAKVTSAAKVSTAQAQQYYKQNQAAYHQAESREVRHILVGTKSLAETLETKLKNGASFVALAKKYSKDTGSAATGGKICAVHGVGTPPSGCSQTVPPFDKAAFSLKTGAISPPVHSQFGWHIIQALGPVKPAKTQSFKDAQGAIQQQLLTQQQSTLWSTWLANLKKQYEGKVSYQAGYAPPTTSTTPAVPAPTTTG